MSNLYEPVDFLRAGQKAHAPALDPAPLQVEEEATGRANGIRKTSTGEQQYHVAKLQGELQVLLRNVENGYADGYTGFRIAVVKRTLELLGVAA